MKVHIIGAGPAGSIAAISAVRNGYDVLVSEDHNSAGEPANCSGLLSRDGLQSLSGFVDYRKSVINRIHGADIHLVDQKMCIRKNMPVGFVCDRSVLDKELAAKLVQFKVDMAKGVEAKAEALSRKLAADFD